jgi:hypothetical protein
MTFMSVFSPLQRLRYWAAAVLLPALLCACSSDGSDMNMEEPQIASSNQYINLNIVVSSGTEGTMRGPAGGENGDGREAGSERENAVTGVTVMLYKDDAGINTSAETTLAFIKYYPVSLVSRQTAGTPYGDTKTDEAVYTTGDQPLAGSGLDMSESYHAIVVANLNMTAAFTTASKVKTVRDYVTTHIYNGTGIGADASHFVMSLETDYTVNFASPSSMTTTGNKITYVFDGIRIERLAARVDFWTNHAEYGTKDGSDNAYLAPGYVYPVWKSSDTDTPTSTDKFVLTAVTPFNLYTDGEYLFKRTNDAAPYLADETTANYVIDPRTDGKTTVSPDYYQNTLAAMVALETSEQSLSDATGYFQSASALHGSTTQKAGFTADAGKDNFILAYPKENTLSTSSPLYYYATGVAIEGDYYPSGSAADPSAVKHLVYYGYLRHQGEGGSTIHRISPKDDLSTTATYPSSTPMNFGVVRNNIYRISIDRVDEKKDLEINIKVKKWDTFTHATIYM